MPTNSKKNEAHLKDREKGFDLRFSSTSRQLPQYNALRDVNMRNYFESQSVQKHLLESGQVDHFGRIVNLEKQRSRLRTIENEIERAERIQQLVDKDEGDVRYLVRKERFRVIDQNRRLENVERQKSERMMQMELTRVERDVLGQSHLYAGNHGRTGGENQHTLARLDDVKEGSSQENRLVVVGDNSDFVHHFHHPKTPYENV